MLMPVFLYHEVFNPNEDEVADLKDRYRKGRVGDVEVKQRLAAALNGFLAPIRERRNYYQQHLELVSEALLVGTRRAKSIAEATILEVRDNMRISRYTES